MDVDNSSAVRLVLLRELSITYARRGLPTSAGRGSRASPFYSLHSLGIYGRVSVCRAYKAQERGMQVIKVDPRHTSQTCSFCHFQHRSNRRSQSLFKCRECGYTLNADLNASYNIREKHLARVGRPFASGSPSCGLSSQSSD